MKNETTVYFHEDDYCQIELLPASARDFAQDQARQMEEFAEAHWTGYGWSDIFVASDPPEGIGTWKIVVDDLDAFFPLSAKRFDHVLTGYASHRETATQTLAWEEAKTLYFANHDAHRIVQHIWLDIWRIGEGAAARLLLLGKKLDLLLADWAWSRVIDLQDEAIVVGYLKERSGGGRS